jgi:hypothetical protein
VSTTAEIEKSTVVLTGAALWAFRRIADLAVFHFGEKAQVKTFQGETAEVGRYALHVQCAWRIAREDSVVVGSGDLYAPAGITTKQFRSDFDWKRDPTRLDELMGLLFKNGARQFLVRTVEVGVGSSLCLGLDSGLVLEIFPDDSLCEEYWRLLQPGKDEPHFVVAGTDEWPTLS